MAGLMMPCIISSSKLHHDPLVLGVNASICHAIGVCIIGVLGLVDGLHTSLPAHQAAMVLLLEGLVTPHLLSVWGCYRARSSYHHCF